MPLPITSRQRAALRRLRRTHPELAMLATSIERAFDPSKVDNPEMARVILDVTFRRIIDGDPLAYEALLKHLEHFGNLRCFVAEQLVYFVDQAYQLKSLDKSSQNSG